MTWLYVHARLLFKSVAIGPRYTASPEDTAMDDVDAAELGVETKAIASLTPCLHFETCSNIADIDGESTPTKSKRESSPTPPYVPHRRRGHGFAPVFEDRVEVYTVSGERMEFDTKDITTGDLRYAIALRRGLPASQVRLFCGQTEVTDEIPVMVGQLSVAFRFVPEPALFSTSV